MTDPTRDRRAIIDYCRKNEFFAGIKNLEKKVAAWLDAYPIDVLAEMKKMSAWLTSTGRRYKDYGRFINSWLSRAAGDPIMRPPSVNEVLAKIGKALDIEKMGAGGRRSGAGARVDEQARLRELREQAEKLLRDT